MVNISITENEIRYQLESCVYRGVRLLEKRNVGDPIIEQGTLKMIHGIIMVADVYAQHTEVRTVNCGFLWVDTKRVLGVLTGYYIYWTPVKKSVDLRKVILGG